MHEWAYAMAYAHSFIADLMQYAALPSGGVCTGGFPPHPAAAILWESGLPYPSAFTASVNSRTSSSVVSKLVIQRTSCSTGSHS